MEFIDPNNEIVRKFERAKLSRNIMKNAESEIKRRKKKEEEYEIDWSELKFED